VVRLVGQHLDLLRPGRRGTWRYKLDYPGDANNNALSLPCVTASVQVSGVATRAVVDGTPVGHANQYWGKPVFTSGSFPWVTWWEYDTGRVVTADTQPFTVEFQETATKSGTDGSGTWNAGDDLLSTGPCLVNGFQP
jgi:hypothetical protein